MIHPDCLHATANSSADYSGVECCCCVGNVPCDRVTAEQMAAHRDFDLWLFTGEVKLYAPRCPTCDNARKRAYRRRVANGEAA